VNGKILVVTNQDQYVVAVDIRIGQGDDVIPDVGYHIEGTDKIRTYGHTNIRKTSIRNSGHV
jgi:hypothetical protein